MKSLATVLAAAPSTQADEDEIGDWSISASKQLQYLRFVAYLAIISVGIAEAWTSRHVIFSDGISYIEIATAYLRHDWMNALNAYWSPLYSWLLAALFWLIRPSSAWQPAVLHLLNLLAYIAALLSLEIILYETAIWLDAERRLYGAGTLSTLTVYIVGYSVFPLAMVGIIGYPAPDLIGAALLLLITGLILRVRRTGGSPALFLLIGALCGAHFLARTAFAASIPVCVLVIGLVLAQQKRPVLYPAFLIALATFLVAGPFVLAVSSKEGRFTLGESGKLTYAWEVNHAPRFMYWEGKPPTLGKAIHPAKQVSHSPSAYVFDGPVGGTFPPWFDPSYWYAGVRPQFSLPDQLHAILVNSSSEIRLLATSPITVPVVLLVGYMGLRLWFRRFIRFWPLLSLSVTGLGLYSLIYVEKRYVVAHFVIVWLALIASLRIINPRWRYCANVGTRLLCLIFFSFFLSSRVMPAITGSLSDLVHRSEREPNVNRMLSERLKQIGLRPGDKVAFIGEGLNNTEWARLVGVRVIGEVPVIWERPRRLFDNYLRENSAEIRAFWNASPAIRKHILDAFRASGAVMVVTDGLFNNDFPPEWHQILLPAQIGDAPPYEDRQYEIRSKARFLWLVPR